MLLLRLVLLSHCNRLSRHAVVYNTQGTCAFFPYYTHLTAILYIYIRNAFIYKCTHDVHILLHLFFFCLLSHLLFFFFSFSSILVRHTCIISNTQFNVMFIACCNCIHIRYGNSGDKPYSTHVLKTNGTFICCILMAKLSASAHKHTSTAATAAAPLIPIVCQPNGRIEIIRQYYICLSEATPTNDKLIGMTLLSDGETLRNVRRK